MRLYLQEDTTNWQFPFLPPANEVWGKVMFPQMFVCPQEGRRFVSRHMNGERGFACWGSASGGSASRGNGSVSRGGGLRTGGGQVGRPPTRTRKAGCTHPTGMLPCCNCNCFNSNSPQQVYGNSIVNYIVTKVNLFCLRPHNRPMWMNLCTFYIFVFLSSTEEAHIKMLITYSDIFIYPFPWVKGRDNLQVLIHRITQFQHLALAWL